MPNQLVLEPLVRAALLEDIGHGHDLTTDAIVPPAQRCTARIVARETGIVAGIDAATLVFTLLDPSVMVTVYEADGRRVEARGCVAEIEGPARAILTGERTALNLLCRLSGIATATRTFVDVVAGARPDGKPTHIVDTRKTTPGLRILEKYAVRCGGGSNHRFGLDDAVLIKDNHIAVAGSIHAAVSAVRASVGHMVKVEVEVDTLDQLRQALSEPIDAVLLDNMPPSRLRDAVAIVGGRLLTEASGGVRLDTVRAIAETGVDLISVGQLTLGAPSLDLGLDVA